MNTNAVRKEKNNLNNDTLTHFSNQVFNIRRMLIEQFNRIEKDLQNKFSDNQEKFATKEELQSVIGKMQEFRQEIEKTFTTNESNPLEPAADEFFTGLNPFNLRRKYHDFSLRLRSEEVDPFGYDPIFDKFVSPLLNFFYIKYWRVETYGISNIPSDGPALLVGNHSGGLPYDATMLKIAIQREHHMHRDLRFMVEDFLFHFPFLGSLMNRFGGVRASQENAQQLLENNHPVVVFPEGVKGLGKLYRDKYHLARFGRGGFIRLCLRTRSPLIPIAFIGPEEIHPMIAKETAISKMLGLPYTPITWTFPWLGPLGAIPLPSKWSIHILPAIDFTNFGPGAEKDRVLVYKMSRMVKEQIQDTIVDKLKNRRSIWFD
ncbi:lysophospholipid acyltransferase family protein [Fluviispira vulneris]|uniref:lysophospholipid acyltransferase family protein n=1 Tax=Fluviispira vulneris TaxID=2763012 RepID=UPI0016455B3B|nr:lysophospholipid acyltransferase family protein [Fluviispira vulneris]